MSRGWQTLAVVVRGADGSGRSRAIQAGEGHQGPAGCDLVNTKATCTVLVLRRGAGCGFTLKRRCVLSRSLGTSTSYFWLAMNEKEAKLRLLVIA